MSMEMYVLSPRRLTSMDKWQESAEDLRFPIKFPEPLLIDEMRGFLPVYWKNRKTGFECDHWVVEDIQETYKAVKIDQRFTSAIAFRWGADFNELVAAWQAAAAYAVAADGIVFDCETGEIYSAARAVEIARDTEAALPQAELAMQQALNGFGSKS
jgi:hypothetical protein